MMRVFIILRIVELEGIRIVGWGVILMVMGNIYKVDINIRGWGIREGGFKGGESLVILDY